MLTFEITFIVLQKFLHQNSFLFFIYLHDRFQDLEIVLVLICGFRQSLHILRETASAVTYPREQEALTDTVIRSNPFSDRIYISTHDFTKIGYLIHKSDLCSQE